MLRWRGCGRHEPPAVIAGVVVVRASDECPRCDHHSLRGGMVSATAMRTLAFLVFVVTVPVAAFGQPAIGGMVSDPSGAPMAGVLVEASSTALIEKTTEDADRCSRPLPHGGSGARHVPGQVHPSGLEALSAGRRRVGRILHGGRERRTRGRIDERNDHGHR